MTRRRKLLLGGGVVVAGVAAGVAVALVLPGPDAAGDEPKAATETVEVARRTLVRTTEENGTLRYGTESPLGTTAPGTVTWLPEVGSVVDRGQVVARVDEVPVVVLIGALPLYRSLGLGAKGADVRQLEENLAALGYGGFTVDDRFTSSTATAVRAWQKDLGLDRTGRVDSEHAVVTTGPIRVASHSARVGDPAGPELLKVTGTDHLAFVDLPVSDRDLATVDKKVDVELPGSVRVPGTVVRVGAPVTPESDPNDPQGGGDEATIPVTVRIDDPTALGGLDVTPVAVTFAADERADVLAVPVRALLALAEGGYGLEVVDGSGTRLVAVETGMFADGYVEVTPPAEGDVEEGDSVVVPS